MISGASDHALATFSLNLSTFSVVTSNSLSKEDLASIEGFDEALSEELISRAKNYLERKDKEAEEKIKEMKVDKKLIELGVFSNSTLLKLAENNILKLDDLADLAADELMEILPELDENTASEIIMKAREHWFK